MKMKKGIKALVAVFFFFSFLSSVYLLKPFGQKRMATFPVILEQMKVEHTTENGTDIKTLKAIIDLAKRYLPIS